MISRRGITVWIIAALGLLAFGTSTAGAAEGPCNGAAELCDRPFDEVVLPGSHNSMSAAENNWALPNQTYSISNQLKLGARAMLFDTYYGERQENGTVTNIGESEGHATGAQTFMCHTNCLLGSVDLTAELGRIAEFMAANPNEVLTFVNEDHIHPDDFAEAVEESGLIDYVYEGSSTDFPTVGEMIDSGGRILMLAEGDSGDVPWYHEGYGGTLMETPYTFLSSGELTDPVQLEESCRPNRGAGLGQLRPLFLMNHWVTTGVTPEVGQAAIVNTRPVLVARAKACQEARLDKLPTILAVDFFGAGDEVGAARELNGLPDIIPPPPPPDPDPDPDPAPDPDPQPTPTRAKLGVIAPKAAKVKAGKKVVLRVKVANTGDAAATGVKVCAVVPAKLARKPRCVKVASIAPGGLATLKLTVATKKRFKKAAGKVKYTVSSSEPTLKASSKLTVKPLKKKASKGKKRR